TLAEVPPSPARPNRQLEPAHGRISAAPPNRAVMSVWLPWAIRVATPAWIRTSNEDAAGPSGDPGASVGDGGGGDGSRIIVLVVSAAAAAVGGSSTPDWLVRCSVNPSSRS